MCVEHLKSNESESSHTHTRMTDHKGEIETLHFIDFFSLDISLNKADEEICTSLFMGFLELQFNCNTLFTQSYDEILHQNNESFQKSSFQCF